MKNSLRGDVILMQVDYSENDKNVDQGHTCLSCDHKSAAGELNKHLLTITGKLIDHSRIAVFTC